MMMLCLRGVGDDLYVACELLQVDGTADQRITITAAGGSANRDSVVLRGGGDSRVFEVHHDFYTIEVRELLSKSGRAADPTVY